MFSPGKSGREIRDFEISRFSGSICRDAGKCLYISKDFSSTNIYHSDIKNELVFLVLPKLKVFLLTKNYFSKFAKFFKTNCF